MKFGGGAKLLAKLGIPPPMLGGGSIVGLKPAIPGRGIPPIPGGG